MAVLISFSSWLSADAGLALFFALEVFLQSLARAFLSSLLFTSARDLHFCPLLLDAGTAPPYKHF